MKEELLNSFTAKALEYLNSAEAFLKAEVPAYVQELLLYNFYSNLIGLIPLLIGASICIFILYKARKYVNNPDVIFALFPAIALVLCLAGAFDNINTIIKIKVAPRVFLIEHLKR